MECFFYVINVESVRGALGVEYASCREGVLEVIVGEPFCDLRCGFGEC